MNDTTVKSNTSSIKGILRIVFYIVLILTVITAMVFVRLDSRKAGDKKPENTTASGAVDSEEPGNSDDDNPEAPVNNNNGSDGKGETVTRKPLPTAPSQGDSGKKETEQIEAFLSGNYYMQFVTPEDLGSPVEMAFRGKDFQMSMSMDGMKFTALYLDGKFYMINPDEGTYLELTKTLMSTMGMDISELTEAGEEFDFSQFNFTKVDRAAVKKNGTDYILYTYSGPEVVMYFYLSDGELKIIEVGDNSGAAEELMNILKFSPTIPSNMLTVSGLKKTNMLSFFSSMMELE